MGCRGLSVRGISGFTCVAVAVFAVALLAVDGAAAHVLYVEDSGGGNCFSPAESCQLSSAVGLAVADPASDTINLAPGLYADGATDAIDATTGVGLNNIRFVGAGVDSTMLAPETGAVIPYQFAGTGIVLENLRLGGGNSADSLVSTTGELTIRNAVLEGGGSVTRSTILAEADASVWVDRSEVVSYNFGTASTRAAIAMIGSDPGGLKVTDSTITVNDSGRGTDAINVKGPYGVDIARTAIRMRTTAAPATMGFGVVTHTGAADSSVGLQDVAIAGGTVGVRIAATSPGSVFGVFRGLSVDAGTPGLRDAGGFRSLQVGVTAASTGGVQVADSVLVDDVAVVGGALACETTAFFGDAGGVGCTGRTTGSLAANFPSLNAATVFPTVAEPGRGTVVRAFTPGPGGTAVLDNAGGFGAGPVDLAGSPRNVDASDADCLARVDRGAIERQGLVTPVGQCPAGTAARPVMSRLKLTPRTPKSKSAGRARFAFSLSTPAAVKARLDRLSKGRKVGKRCRKPSRANRKRRKCTLAKRVRTVNLAGKAGQNVVTLKRLSGRTKLAAGKYRITVAATGAGGSARPVAVRFVVKRR